MSLKKYLKSKEAQAMIEYLCVAMITAAALLVVSLLPRIQNSFITTADTIMVSKFGAQVQE